MPQVNPKCFHLSASSIASFKACPVRFRLAYREGLRLAEDTDSQRMGTNWHRMHEIYYAAFNAWVPGSGMTSEQVQTCCKNAALEAVIEHLNTAYATRPLSKTEIEWSWERQVMLVSFIGYLWYWSNDPIEVLASEIPFDLPVHVPKTGLPLPVSQVLRVGKIDHLVRWQGMVGTVERKSTARNIDPSSAYWDKSRKDTQVSMYALAFRDMTTRPEGMRELDGKMLPTDSSFGNTLYDVWQKPKTKPAMLTQKETAEFIATGVYCDQKFEIYEGPPNQYTVNATVVEIELGKKGFAIRETVEMYGARLLQEIYATPEKFFQRKEITRTDAELAKFRDTLYSVYEAQRVMDKHGNWYENENSCNDPFPCSYKSICYGPGADACCDGKTTPPGFKRIFVDLTVNGQEQEE